jgi:hypothetical protein
MEVFHSLVDFVDVEMGFRTGVNDKPGDPLLNRDGLLLELEVWVKKDAPMLNIDGIWSLAMVGSEFYLLRSFVLIESIGSVRGPSSPPS